MLKHLLQISCVALNSVPAPSECYVKFPGSYRPGLFRLLALLNPPVSAGYSRYIRNCSDAITIARKVNFIGTKILAGHVC